MTRGSTSCRPTGNIVNTIIYPCGITQNYLTRPGSKKAEMMRRMHQKSCKVCEGEHGRLIATQLPTKSGGIGQVTKAITRDLMMSGSGVRIMTGYCAKNTPATAMYNQYITQQLETTETCMRPIGMMDFDTDGIHTNTVVHGPTLTAPKQNSVIYDGSIDGGGDTIVYVA